MRIWILLLIFGSACVLDPSSEAPLPGEVGDGKADDPHAADVLARLMDPTRASVAFECDGPPLSQGELIGLIPPGHAGISVGVEATNPIVATKHSRVCAPLTGCSPWEQRTIDPAALGFGLRFRTASAQSFVAIKYDAYWDTYDGDTIVAAGEGDFAFLNVSATELPRRVLITHATDGSVCVSVATIVSRHGAPQEHETFLVARGTISRPQPGSDPAEAAQLDGISACAGAEPSTAALAAAWFVPGSVSRPIPEASNRCQQADRMCHPITGCTAWRLLSSCSGVPILTSLAVASSGSSLEARLHKGNQAGRAPIDQGSFQAVLAAWNIDGNASTSCIGWTAVQSSTVSTDLGPRRSERQMIGRANR